MSLSANPDIVRDLLYDEPRDVAVRSLIALDWVRILCRSTHVTDEEALSLASAATTLQEVYARMMDQPGNPLDDGQAG